MISSLRSLIVSSSLLFVSCFSLCFAFSSATLDSSLFLSVIRLWVFDTCFEASLTAFSYFSISFSIAAAVNPPTAAPTASPIPPVRTPRKMVLAVDDTALTTRPVSLRFSWSLFSSKNSLSLLRFASWLESCCSRSLRSFSRAFPFSSSFAKSS